MDKLKSKYDLQNALGVSAATINNWIKTGVIEAPACPEGFTETEFDSAVNKISSGESHRLTSRANRSRAHGNTLYMPGGADNSGRKMMLKAVRIHEAGGMSIEESLFSVSYTFLRHSGLLGEHWYTAPASRLDQFFLSWAKESSIDPAKVTNRYESIRLPHIEDDFLGFFYQSIRSISSRSNSGVYYTPAKVLENIRVYPDQSILDPCCGSGSILLKVLGKDHDPGKIFARDIDELSLKLCRINLHLFFNDPDILPCLEKKDLLSGQEPIDLFTSPEDNTESFDFIISNPPWGSKIAKAGKKSLHQMYPELETTESFSIALYNAYRMLAAHGVLVFFLPYSFLNVSAHRNIRRFLLKTESDISITLLQDAFRGVMSEAVKLTLKKYRRSQNITVYSREGDFKSSIPFASLKSPDFIIPAGGESGELDLVNKIFHVNHLLLKNNAFFALGIVTGNNSKHLLSMPEDGTEPIYRGKNVLPFRFSRPDSYILTDPATFQQAPSMQIYRKAKIVYRFISDKIICLTDRSGSLLLNSANLFIPLFDYPLETIACLLNSKLYTCLYRTIYHSKKVLRSHLESFPFPVIEKENHDTMKNLHDALCNGENLYHDLNQAVYDIFSLNSGERDLVEKKVKG